MFKKLNKILSEVEAILITSPYNMRYFSSFSGGEGALLITNGRRILFTDSRYKEQAENEAKAFEVVDFSSLNDICKMLCEMKASSVAFEDSFVTARYLLRLKEQSKAEFIGKSDEINNLRMIKEDFEIEKIERAEEIGDMAFSHILGYIKEGVSERDLAAEIEYFMRKCGAEKTSFDTIAISGKKTSMPHGRPSGKKIENGDFITLDFGCVYEGYCSDMTRTVVLGKASNRQKEIYEIVRRAQEAGLSAIKRGVSCFDADKAARDVIEGAGYGKNFGHSLGHGVGLLIHEAPTLSPKSDIVLCDNMIVSCEPGIYIPDFGGVRIEDLVCVRGDKCRVLSKSSKKLTEI